MVTGLPNWSLPDPADALEGVEPLSRAAPAGAAKNAATNDITRIVGAIFLR